MNGRYRGNVISLNYKEIYVSLIFSNLYVSRII